ncbi:hypothetical protein BD413DRAFT_82753 [Trametes elegans]|nr:hypothetical protein BD413DRAFT_82753 [Trametes elegans]
MCGDFASFSSFAVNTRVSLARSVSSRAMHTGDDAQDGDFVDSSGESARSGHSSPAATEPLTHVATPARPRDSPRCAVRATASETLLARCSPQPTRTPTGQSYAISPPDSSHGTQSPAGRAGSQSHARGTCVILPECCSALLLPPCFARCVEMRDVVHDGEWAAVAALADVQLPVPVVQLGTRAGK